MDPQERPTLGELAGTTPRGLRCPACGASSEWTVYYTREIPGAIRRVRICRLCSHRIVTTERRAGA